MANAKVDLPQPDSPAMPRTFPLLKSMSTSLTARTARAPSPYSTTRPRAPSTVPGARPRIGTVVMSETDLAGPGPLGPLPSWLFGPCVPPSTANRRWRARVVRSLGLTISSMEKFNKARPIPSNAIQRPGGTNHHQAPSVNACALWVQYSIVPQLHWEMFTRPKKAKLACVIMAKMTVSKKPDATIGSS